LSNKAILLAHSKISKKKHRLIFYDKPDERFAFEQKKFEEKLLTERIRMSAALVSAQKTDYVEMTDAFKEARCAKPCIRISVIQCGQSCFICLRTG
jgi:hypothetical protein